MIKEFTTLQAAQLTGASLRQLDYWDKIGLMKPTATPAKGSGSIRKYSFIDLVQIKTIKYLKEGGITLQKIRKGIEYLRQHMLKIKKPLAELKLVALARNQFALVEGNKYIDLVNNPGQMFLFVAPIGQIAKETEEQVKALQRVHRLASERIHIDPDICNGAPCIAGTRIPVSTIFHYHKHGYSIEKIVQEFDITEPDVKAALDYTSITHHKGRPRKYQAA